MTDPPRMVLCILALCWVPAPALAQAELKPAYAGKFVNFTSPRSTPSGPSDIVHVAPPTGERDPDRTSILAALERARPGDTIQFASGTYLVGERIKVPTSRLTVLGHPAGTTLRGCDPAAYEEMERTVIRRFKDMRAVPPRASLSDMSATMLRCGLLELTGGHAAVRYLTFEYTRAALILGCCADEFKVRPGNGGYRIEDNTFRNLDIAILTWLASTEPTVIRGNTIVNTFHAVSGAGSHVHVLNNAISAPGSDRVPGRGHPGFAIGIGSAPGDSLDPAANGCENIIAGNRVEGHPDGINILAAPGTACRRNVIRDNTIVFRRIRFTESAPWASIFFPRAQADSTIVGVPLALVSPPDPTGHAGVLEDNLIEGNRVIGAEGIGIEISRASRNRIMNNSITGIRRRDPFPGNTLAFPPARWRDANGSGIWVSPGSDENEITGNTFEDIAASAVVVEGNRNVVTTPSASDAVRDLGSGNRISVARRAAQPDTLETGRLTVHQVLHPVGEESYTITREGDGYLLRAAFVSRFRGAVTVRSATLRLGPDLAPRSFRHRVASVGEITETTVEVRDGRATITAPSGSTQVSGLDRFFTASGVGPHAVPMLLVRYWLATGRPDSIRMLPTGYATVSQVGRDTLVTGGKPAVLGRYHVDGTWWGGQTLWLDGAGQLVAAVTFAEGYRAVREGYEDHAAWFSRRARLDVLSRGEVASRGVPPLQAGTFALVGGTLIDGTGAPALADATVVIRDGRIADAGPRARVAIPSDAAAVDVTGRTLLPGLWDMHGHIDGIVDWGPIYLAAGVTTVRHVAGDADWQLALRDAFASGRIAGPRLLIAGIVESSAPGARPESSRAETPEEARALVRRFHQLGFDQIKIYTFLKPELVPVIAAEAHRLGMTVTGHIPAGTNAIVLVEAGMDQINHLRAGLLTRVMFRTRPPDPARAYLDADLGSAIVRRLIDVLLRHGTVLDPTLAAVEPGTRPTGVPLQEVEPGAARMPPLVAANIEALTRSAPANRADAARAEFRKHLAVLGVLHRAGVPIVAGTDVVVPGHSLHRELELYVEAGMAPMEAIQSATIVAARAMRLDDEVGTIEVGKRADLIVVEGDPLRSIREIRNLRAVIANGRMFDTATLWRSVGFQP
jgi:parallel beta-helix repeat protein